jgi:xylulokinase
MGTQSQVSAQVAAELGLSAGTPITYRAGDQPNNAFSLNVLEPGEVAATAGTSGVIYAVTEYPAADLNGRVNTFMHVSHQPQAPRNGVLACVNGTGRAYSWLRQILGSHGGAPSYAALNHLADATAIGAEGLCVLPFGNGAERLLQNKNLGAHFSHIDHNRHQLSHMIRATQEGIAFALNKGFDVLNSIGVQCNTIKAGKSNLFLSPLFAEAFANTTGATIELYNTDGADGAARAAAVGAGFYASAKEAFTHLSVLETIIPTPEKTALYQAAYQRWDNELQQQLHTLK